MNWRVLSRSRDFSALLTVGAFGLTPLFKKLAITDGVSPWTVALVTSLVAAAVGVTLLLVRGPDAWRSVGSPVHRAPLCVLGVVASGIVTLLVVQALTSTTATNHSLFQSAYPAATLLFAHLLLGECLRVAQYAAVAALTAGLLLVNGGENTARFGKCYPGGEVSLFFVGGAGRNDLQSGNTVTAPLRFDAAWRQGVNVGRRDFAP